MGPLVSVIIPTYNRAHVIGTTIESVLSQTYRNLEVIVVDDGSTDDTAAVLRLYSDHLRVIVQDNAGPAVARNRGFQAARGEIIAFQDSDDLWRPTKLEHQLSLLQKTDKSVPCCLCNASLRFRTRKHTTSFENALMFPPYEEGIWLNVKEVLATRFVLFTQTAAIRREALEQVGGFNEKLKYLEDYDLPLRLALEGPWTFIREPLVIWQEGSTGSWSEKAYKDKTDMQECLVQIFDRALTEARQRCLPTYSQRLLQWELNRARRHLRIAKITGMDCWCTPIARKLLHTLERYRSALFRRSSWFPKMQVIPINH